MVVAQGVVRFLIDVIYPPRCAGCLRRGHWVCRSCRSRFPIERDQWCARCGARWCTCAAETQTDLRVYAFGPYDDWLRQAIISYKYHAERARHEHLGALLVPMVEALGPVDGLVPVPLHRHREHERGYNQARLLAQTAASSASIPVFDALVRSVDTRQQATLAGELRRTNVVGAFHCSMDVKGLHLLLVDDVVTTGATVGECAAELSAAGAAHVQVIALAHG